MEHVSPSTVAAAPQGAAIITALAKIMGDAGHVEKTGENKFHNYTYAKASDILAKLQPLMAREGLIVFQTEIKRELLEGGTILAVEYEFTLAHKSGEVWPEKIRRTGMCSAKNSKGGFDDKSVNKCTTGAHKYFLLTLFEIPTGDYPEADADDDAPPSRHRQERGSRRQERPQPQTFQPDEPKPTPAAVLEVAQTMVDAIKKRMSKSKLDGLVNHPDWKRDYASLEPEDRTWVDSVLAAQRAAIDDPTADTDEPTPPDNPLPPEDLSRQAVRREPEPVPAHTPGRLSQAALRTVQQNQRPPSKTADLIDDDIPF